MKNSLKVLCLLTIVGLTACSSAAPAESGAAQKEVVKEATDTITEESEQASEPVSEEQQEEKRTVEEIMDSLVGDYDEDEPRCASITKLEDGRYEFVWSGGYPITTDYVVDYDETFIEFYREDQFGGEYYKIIVNDGKRMEVYYKSHSEDEWEFGTNLYRIGK